MSLSIGEQLLWIAAGATLLMAGLWLVQIRTRDAGIVDAGWAMSLAGAAAFAASTGSGDFERRLLVAIIAGVWGLRLASHVIFDRVLKGEEDGRYQALRERLGPRASIGFLLFFLAQGVLVVVLCPPFLIAAADQRGGLAPTDWLGASVWLIGLTGEVLADRQLQRFKADPANRGRVCAVGLWRYSRHPNYFFEWLMWCAYAIIALHGPWGWLAIASPAIMLVLVLKVTGIPPTEARALRSRGDAYRRYQETTSAFIPWFPKGSLA